MTSPVRVCHVITGLEVGGAETMLAKLCETIDRERVRSTVIALRAGGPLADRIRAAGVEVIELDMPPGSPRAAFMIGRLRQAVLGSGADVVQGWMYHANMAAVLSFLRRPVLWNIRQTLYDPRRERPITRLVIRASAGLSRIPRVIVYNSEVSAAQHAARGFSPDRARVIPNGFDAVRFRPDARARAQVRAELGIGPSEPVVGLVARLHPMKNHRMFVAAARRILEAIPNAHFVMVGDGVTRAAFPDELGGRLHALGTRSNLERLTAALDVACSTSSWGEGFPNVLGEALSCAVPAVATDVGDSRMIVGDAGIIVSPGDTQAFADAVRRLIEQPEARRRMGDAGRTRVLQRFSIGAIADTYTSLYQAAGRGQYC